MSNPEHDLAIVSRLEAINQDENIIAREEKLNRFYEELDALEADDEEDHEQGADTTPRT